jgi:hypothetical protein
VSSGRKVLLTGVEAVSWDDVNAETVGTLTQRVPEFDPNGDFVELQEGDIVHCFARVYGIGTIEMWDMRVYKPRLTASNSQRVVDLKNDLELLRMSEDNWLFAGRGVTQELTGKVTIPAIPAPGGDNKGGWWGRDIIQEVCRRYGIPAKVIGMGPARKGAAPPGAPWKRRGAKLAYARASPLSIIRNQIVWEKRHTGVRYQLRYVKGTIIVSPLRRNPALRLLGPTLTEASFSSERYPEFASAVTLHAIPDLVGAHSTDPHGKKQKTVVHGHVYRVSDVARRRVRLRPPDSVLPDAWSDGSAHGGGGGLPRGRGEAAAPADCHRAGHPSDPARRRDPASARRRWPLKQIVFVDQASHSVTPAGHTMTLTLIFDDPYIDRARQNIIFLLKGTLAEAIGDRQRTDPNWPSRREEG